MTRLLTFAILAACVLALGAAPQQQPVFRGTSDAVRVFVTVTDRDGRLIPTLTQEDFEDPGRREAAADHAVRQHAATHSTHRDARRVGQHGGQPAAAARGCRAALRAAGSERCRACRNVRARRDHQPRVHARCQRASARAAHGDCPRRSDTAMAGGRRSDEHVCRRG